jgi:hypothetical protein
MSTCGHRRRTYGSSARQKSVRSAPDEQRQAHDLHQDPDLFDGRDMRAGQQRRRQRDAAGEHAEAHGAAPIAAPQAHVAAREAQDERERADHEHELDSHRERLGACGRRLHPFGSRPRRDQPEHHRPPAVGRRLDAQRFPGPVR